MRGQDCKTRDMRNVWYNITRYCGRRVSEPGAFITLIDFVTSKGIERNPSCANSAVAHKGPSGRGLALGAHAHARTHTRICTVRGGVET